jgi:hypothetical protein
VEEDVYQASFPGYSIRILERLTKESNAQSDAVDCIVQIFNENGTLMEEIDDIQLREGWEYETPPFITMDAIYVTARRTALGVEQALDNLLNELGE